MINLNSLQVSILIIQFYFDFLINKLKHDLDKVLLCQFPSIPRLKDSVFNGLVFMCGPPLNTPILFDIHGSTNVRHLT